MDCSDTNNCSSCISDVIKKIIILQNKDFDHESYVGCDKPYLGPVSNTVCYNTRPIQLYNCSTGEPWCFTFTNNGSTSTSSILRVETLDDCCCTCRILGTDCDNQYTGTSEFVTIDLSCCGAIRCLADTYIDLC